MTNPNINQILPSQAGNVNKVLTTDGKVASWETVGFGSTAVTSVNSGTGDITIESSDSSVNVNTTGSTIDLTVSGSTLTTPTIVQSAYNSSNTNFSVTLGSTPTVGNILVAIVSGLVNNLNCFDFACEYYQQNNPGIYVFTRRVQSGDSTTIFSLSNVGNYEAAMVYEISHMNDMDIYGSQISNHLNAQFQYAPIARATSPTICLSNLTIQDTTRTITATSIGWSIDHDPTSDSGFQGLYLRRTSNLSAGNTDQAWVEWSANGDNHCEVTVLIR